jgi:hypothetical protein
MKDGMAGVAHSSLFWLEWGSSTAIQKTGGSAAPHNYLRSPYPLFTCTAVLFEEQAFHSIARAQPHSGMAPMRDNDETD